MTFKYGEPASESNRLPVKNGSNKLALLDASGGNVVPAVPVYALRIYVATGTGTVKVTPAGASDADAVTLTFPAGLWIEPLEISKLWQTGTSGVVVHAYTA